jgi:hypothetical protein
MHGMEIGITTSVIMCSVFYDKIGITFLTNLISIMHEFDSYCSTDRPPKSTYAPSLAIL